MRNPKMHNANKHGVYARTAILPGEDPAEFEKLYSDLMEEWIPAGATEEDAVLSIAKAIWRKRRAQRFLELKVAENASDSEHPSYDEALGLMTFAKRLEERPETAFAEAGGSLLLPGAIRYLQQEFPRSRFRSGADWLIAIIREITTVMVPAISLKDSPPEIKAMSDLIRTAASLSGDLFKQEISLDERLDLMIDRAVKRLIQTKAMKQMLFQSNPGRTDNQPKRAPQRTVPKGK